MKFILGKKMSMTQLWVGDKVCGVTPVKAGPCVISQVKTEAKDGYQALQIGFGDRKEKNIKKPQRGHFNKAGIKPAHVKEFRLDKVADFKIGDVISSDNFAVGDLVNVCGVSKGRGFQGVVKRYHFAGFMRTHGNKDQERMGGSVGPKGPAHVFKGTKMGGRMGGERVTTTNLEIVAIDNENDILFIQGAVPGAINALVMIDSKGDLKVNSKKVEEVKAEEPVVEEAVVKEVKAEEIKVEEKIEDKVEEVKVEEKVEEPKVEEGKK